MAVATRRQTVVNSARKNAGRKRKLSPAQIKAGFGGKRRQAAVKAHRKAKRKAVKVNRSGPRRKTAVAKHRPRTAPRAKRRSSRRASRPNLGKIISFSLPKESTSVATKKNRSRKAYHTKRRRTKANTGRRRHVTRRNPGMGDVAGLATSAVFTIAGAVGTKYLTQMVLTSSNTGVMGYLGNLVSAFLLSWGVKAFMKNDRAAAAVLSGGIVQVVLRLIADYTPFGQYTANLGMGDYLAQNWTVPQRIAYQTHSAQLMPPTMNGMSGCNSLYAGSSLYA